MMRAADATPVIWPRVELLTLLLIWAVPPDPFPISAPTLPAYWWWFHALKKSPAILKFTRSVIAKFLATPISQLLIPGWRRKLRLELPYSPSGGCEKQSGLMRCNTLVRFALMLQPETRLAR